MPVTFRIALGPVLVLACAGWLAGCDECETSRDCGTGKVCIDGTCETPEPFDPGSDTDGVPALDTRATDNPSRNLFIRDFVLSASLCSW